MKLVNLLSIRRVLLLRDASEPFGSLDLVTTKHDPAMYGIKLPLNKLPPFRMPAKPRLHALNPAISLPRLAVCRDIISSAGQT